MQAVHLSCLLALATFQSATAGGHLAHKVTWAIPTSPQAMYVKKGTEVTFEWTGNHDVKKMANKADYDSCATTSGTVGAPATNGGTWKTTLNTIGTHYFICSVGTHCANGQKVAITVDDYVVDWVIPTFPQAITVTPGSQIGFVWTGNVPHDVYKSVSKADFDACKKTGGLQSAPQTAGGYYRVGALSSSTAHYFICTVGSHCANGQKIAIIVGDDNNTIHNPNPEPEPEPNTTVATNPMATSSGASFSSPFPGAASWFWILLSSVAPLVF